MGKSIVKEAKQEVKNNKKENRKMKYQPIIEKIKTIALTALVTGIIAFIGGVWYQTNVTNSIHTEAKSLASSIKTESLKQ